MQITLLIDDIRNIECDIIARNSSTGYRCLKYFHGEIDTLYLDHDLGPNSKSGYTLACQALQDGIMPPTVILVTSNPVGRDNIIAALKQFGYTNRAGEMTTWRKDCSF